MASNGAPQNRIYLDHNATTPVDPRVAEAACAVLKAVPGNPSSSHWAGAEARAVLDQARAQVAARLGAPATGVVFTSGATESNHLAILGAARAAGRKGHLVSQATEHPSVLAPLRALEAEGWSLTLLRVDGEGLVDPADLRTAIRPGTVLVSVMLANNETGALQDIPALATACKERGVLFHCDASQALGKEAWDVRALGVDLLSVAGHKAYAPKGVGALVVREGVTLAALQKGGGQEHGLRAGTESPFLAAALGRACEIIEPGDPGRLRDLRDRLHQGLTAVFGRRLRLNGPAQRRLSNTLNVGIQGLDTALLASRLPDLAISGGSACHGAAASSVLLAMGLSGEEAGHALRFSVGRFTTAEEIDQVVAWFRRGL